MHRFVFIKSMYKSMFVFYFCSCENTVLPKYDNVKGINIIINKVALEINGYP